LYLILFHHYLPLGIPIAEKATVKMMSDLLQANIPNCYQFEVINGYVYVGIPSTRDVMWPYIKATLTQGKKMLASGVKRWNDIRNKLQETALKWSKQNLESLTALQLVDGVREIFGLTAEYYTVVQSGPIPNATSSEITFTRFYNSLVKRKEDPEGVTLLFGLENQALRAEKSLFDIAVWLREQPELIDFMKQKPAEEIVNLLTSSNDNSRWDELRSRFAAYLAEFGHAIYDLDFARPLPINDPAPLVEAIKAYMAGTGSNPYERQREADERREKTIAVMTRRLDPLRRKWFFKLLKWAVDTAPLREDSIADLGLGHPQIRRLLEETGQRLAERKVIGCAQDVYWLKADELETLALKMDKDEQLEVFYEQIENRKAELQSLRHVTPPATLPKDSWMSRLMPRHDQKGDTIKGFASSVGKVTAPACVMFGPEDFYKMKQGDVIVAVTTTPAWTPLFTLASAVVTDIGGPLSHSSIVAREYGIPAVLATGVITRRVIDGQMITVDGGAGTVILNDHNK
jgi:rifampicin phosphotransferase